MACNVDQARLQIPLCTKLLAHAQLLVSTSRRPFIFFWTSRYGARHAICFRDFSLPGNGLQDRVTG
jgi:hypothetical protein